MLNNALHKSSSNRPIMPPCEGSPLAYRHRKDTSVGNSASNVEGAEVWLMRGQSRPVVRLHRPDQRLQCAFCVGRSHCSHDFTSLHACRVIKHESSRDLCDNEQGGSATSGQAAAFLQVQSACKVAPIMTLADESGNPWSLGEVDFAGSSWFQWLAVSPYTIVSRRRSLFEEVGMRCANPNFLCTG